jgi:hypothetical protein
MMKEMTPKDIQIILGGIGKWAIGMTLVGATIYLSATGKISGEVISNGTIGAIAFYFGGKGNS